MKVKRKENKAPVKNLLVIAVLTIGCIFCYSMISFAGASFWQMAANAYGQSMADRTVVPVLEADLLSGETDASNQVLGATSGFCQSGAATTTLCKIDFGDDASFANMVWFSGEVKFAATTTTGISEGVFHKKIGWAGATSTMNCAGDCELADQMTDNFLVNTWGKSLCKQAKIVRTALTEDLGVYTGLGTSTPTSTASLYTTSTFSLIALTQLSSTTDTIGNAVSIGNPDYDVLTTQNDAGSYFSLNSDAAAEGLRNNTTTLYWFWESGDAVTFAATNSMAIDFASSTPFAEMYAYADIECELVTHETAQ